MTMETIMTGHQYAGQDARAIMRAVLSDLVTHGLTALGDWLRREQVGVDGGYCDARIIDRDEDGDYAEANAVIEAAALLGVRIDASADEVRSAFRRCVKEQMATESGFHDQGGDSTDPRAQRLIAAKNLLIERVKEHANVEG